MRSRIVNSPFTFAETGVNDADQNVPGATLAASGPSSGTDTVLVTFSAESQLTGGDASDWMGLEVHLDGVPINPFTASGDIVAFTGEPSWNANSLQFCAKLRPGSHRFQVTDEPARLERQPLALRLARRLHGVVRPLRLTSRSTRVARAGEPPPGRRVRHQIRTRSAGSSQRPSPSLVPKTSWNSSRLRTMLARNSGGLCGSIVRYWSSCSLRRLVRQQ